MVVHLMVYRYTAEGANPEPTNNGGYQSWDLVWHLALAQPQRLRLATGEDPGFQRIMEV